MFTHLHVHTEFSMLDGHSRLGPLVERTKELGMDSLAITDHGGMYGAIDFYRIAKKAGIKPIIGCEMYVAPDSRHERNPNHKSPFHMTVLSQDLKGYENLVKLLTKSHLEGYYYKPRVDREILEEYNEGLIIMSGCPSGEVPRAVYQGDMKSAKNTVNWYREVFGDRYFLELMSHGDVPELPNINKGLLELHKELGVPVVATNDSHYTDKQDAELQDLLLCIQTNTNVNDENRMRMAEHSYYLRSPQEMADLWPEVPDAISNTQRVAEMCNLELDFTKLRLPLYPLPEGTNADEYLEQLCWEGLRERVDNITPEEEERLKYELEVIKYTQYANYFLVVWDIARFVRERDIFFAVRGSAAASLVLFCLGITNVHPLPYRLVFERFLNVERKEMPDIDMDFQDDRRIEVINYVVEKYGKEHVAQIITFGTMGARASIRDVGRALGMSYGEADNVAKMIPTKLHITLDEALETNPELTAEYESNESVKKLMDKARGMEGLTRHASTHAAAVVISEEPLDDIVPLQRPTKGNEDSVAMTQYAMEPCAALGLLKMDFLGLSNLTILAEARDLIEKTRGVRFELTDIPLDDGNTFELLSRGDTVGVFQLEGGGMTRYIKELKPSSVADVAAMIALYRPGPMEHISTFIDAKHGRIEPHYPHPALRDILEETYGVIVYQDQVLHIVRTFAGYSLGEADIVRKAMGKKIAEIMAQEKAKFVEGALKLGYTNDMADQIFALIEPFAGYAFNKAHSVSYGLISYWTAYLKANFTEEYMVALLNSYMDNTEKIVAAIAECRRLRIPVLPPDINNGETSYSIENTEDGTSAIRVGMAAVKNVGSAAIEPVLISREKEGPFTSIEHMCQVADMSSVNKKTLESLIKAGAFDQFGDRGGLLEVVEKITTLAQGEARRRDSNQTSMFEVMGDAMGAELTSIEIADLNTSDTQKGMWEQELLGVSVSSNKLLDMLASNSTTNSIVFKDDIDPDKAGKSLTITGQVADVTERYTRDGKPFSIVTLALLDGVVEVFVWEDKKEKTAGLWENGKLVTVTGNLRIRDDQFSIGCNEAEEFIPPEDSPEDKAEITDVEVKSIPTEEKIEQNGNAIVHANGNGVNHEVAENGATTEHFNGNGNGTRILPSSTIKVEVSQRLNLQIKESNQPERDKYLLFDLKNVLLEYQGQDEVALEIATEGKIVVMEWPMVRVNACQELEERLKDVLGQSGHAYVEVTS